mgnify:CR=1 FL=1
MSTGQLAHTGRKLTKQDDSSIGTGVHCAEVRCCGAITNVWAEGQRAGDQTNESAAATAAAALATPTSLPSGFQSANPAIDARAKAATTMAQSKAEWRDMAAKAVARSTKLRVSCGVTGGGSLLQALHIHTPHSTHKLQDATRLNNGVYQLPAGAISCARRQQECCEGGRHLCAGGGTT